MDNFDDGEFYDTVEEAEAAPASAEAADHDDWDEVITGDEDEEQGSDSEANEEEADGEEVSNESQVANLEEKEEDSESDEEEDDKGNEGDKSEDEESDDSESPTTDVEADANFDAGKMVKAFAGNEELSISQNTTFKQKVGGKHEIVTLQELQDNYSGQVHFDKKFEELSVKEQQHSAKADQFEQELDLISGHLKDTRQGIESALKGETDIRDAVSNLVDLMEMDVYDFNKALFNAVAEDVYSLAAMDEGSQRAYWAEKKNDHLVKRQENRETAFRGREAQRESAERMANFRQTHNLTEDQYSQGMSELSSLGYTDVSPEQVASYIETVPFAEAASELLSPYQDRLSDDKFNSGMQDLTSALKEGDLTEEEAKLFLIETFEVKKHVETLNRRSPGAKQAPLKKAKSSDSVESFDDYEEDHGSYY